MYYLGWIGSLIWSLGGGAVLVFALSSWLGKIWAERIMNADRSKYAQELESLRASLAASNDQRLKEIATGWDIYKDRFLRTHQDKIAVYRMAVDLVASILAHLDRARELSELPTLAVIMNLTAIVFDYTVIRRC